MSIGSPRGATFIISISASLLQPIIKILITFFTYFVKIVFILNINCSNIFTYWLDESDNRRKNGRDVL
ncbi:MAG TPA: hypothetical protein DCP02_05195 [Actinobacteria bacterium]|nr:hypothetical protein [Actinomycetota bacterium]